jgi:hypothetical protein
MWEGLWKERGGNRPLEGAAAADRERQPASFRAGAWGAKPQQYVNRGASVPVLLEKGGTVGIALTQRRRGEAIVVVAVENGLPAAVDGRIQVGDSLIAVDGIPVPALLQDVLLLMQVWPGPWRRCGGTGKRCPDQHRCPCGPRRDNGLKCIVHCAG